VVIDTMIDTYSKINISPLPDHKFIMSNDAYIFDKFIPKDYITNGADVPRVFWSLIPPNDSLVLPAVIVHDFLCTIANMLFEITGEKEQTYEYADYVFINALEHLKINKNRINIYKTVKLNTLAVRPISLRYKKPIILDGNRKLINNIISNNKGITLSHLLYGKFQN